MLPTSARRLSPSQCLTRELWEGRSVAFLKVVRAAYQFGDPFQVTNGVAFWCRGFPRWYRDWILASLGIAGVPSLMPATPHEAHAVADEFCKHLAIQTRVAAFLLRDAATLARRFETAGGQAVLCLLSRATLPRPRRRYYLDLFDVLNRAVIPFRTLTRSHFCDQYLTLFNRYVTVSKEVLATLNPLAKLVLSSGASAIVDTGMQGTLAFALSATIERISGRRLPVHLAVGYPWLLPILRDTTISWDARVALALEKDSRQGIYVSQS